MNAKEMQQKSLTSGPYNLPLLRKVNRRTGGIAQNESLSVDSGFLTSLKFYAEVFAAEFPRSKTALWAAVYLQGLLCGEDRKNVESMARHVTLPAGLHSKTPDQALQQFINQSRWDEQRVLRRFRTFMAEAHAVSDASLVIHDVCFPKRGDHSVGVEYQHCEMAHRTVNCQIAVCVHYVSDIASFPLALQLHLPGSWLGSAQRLEAAGVPVRNRRPLSKEQLALNLLDELRLEGFCGRVVASKEYGSESFRRALDRRGLSYLVGVPPQEVPVPRASLARRARRWDWAAAGHSDAESVQRQLSTMLAWVELNSGRGRCDEGPDAADALSLFAERQGNGNWRYALSNLSASTSGAEAAALWQRLATAHDSCRLMTERLGLTHFEGRSWHGFHHHATMVFLAFGFLALQHGESFAPRQVRTALKAH